MQFGENAMPSQEDDFVRIGTVYAPETVASIAFSPDGTLLAVASGDKVHIYRVSETCKPRSASERRPASSMPA